MKQLLIISSYPEKGKIHGAKTVGGASYFKSLIQNLKLLEPDLNITILAEYFLKQEKYIEKQVIVNRIWQRNNWRSLIKLHQMVVKYKKDPVLISFEGYMFGNLQYLIIFLALSLIWKLRGIKLYFNLHQVMFNFETMETNLIKSRLMEHMARVFYQIITYLSNRVIVMEENFKAKLRNSKKIIVIPHAINEVAIIDKNKAKTKLGLKKDVNYVLYFGYIAPYKGILELVRIWQDTDRLKLIIAGGENPNHRNNPQYIQYMTQVRQIAEKKGVKYTGFVAEKNISSYFSAADLVILPYTNFISSSGPLSLAFAYEKPVLLSSKLKEYLDSKDITGALASSKLTEETIFFDLKHDQGLENKTRYILNNLTKANSFAKTIKKARSWEVISQLYLNQIEF